VGLLGQVYKQLIPLIWYELEGLCVRKDGTRFYSLFRLGLDFLRRLLLSPKLDMIVWDKVIRVLSWKSAKPCTLMLRAAKRVTGGCGR
jgi:hypothetical protein